MSVYDKNKESAISANSGLNKRNEIEEEQPIVDNVDITFDPNSPKSVLKNSMMRETVVSQNLSEDAIKMRKYKVDQMEDFANEYAISTVETSTFSSVLSVINTVIITVALAIAFMVFFGLIFGIHTCAVVTDSMEPTIPVGSLVMVKSIDDEEIQVGDVLTYIKSDGITYIHRVSSIDTSKVAPDEYLIEFSGDNTDKYPGAIDTIRSGLVQGKYITHIPAMGSFLLWVRANWILVLSITVTLILFFTLLRYLFDKKHNQQVMEKYIEKRDAMDLRHEQKYKAYRKQKEIEEMDNLLNKKRE